jgi:predicted Zn-dependent peptidase
MTCILNNQGRKRMRKFIPSLIVILLLAIFSLSYGQTGDIKVDVKKHTLVNGMKVLVLENHSSPVFSAVIRFNTGAIDEGPGITGISHLLEHMLFKGTKIFGTTDYKTEVPIMAKIDSLAQLYFNEQVRLSSPLNLPDSTKLQELKKQIAGLLDEQRKYMIKEELWNTYLANGGNLNAFTSNNETCYFVSLPKNRLELWALMESDRMENIILREFYSERDVVMEERRLSLENNPRRILDEAMGAMSFWASPYKWTTLGWMSDLQTVRREEAEAYFKSHYSPSNAVVAIAGDIKAEDVFKMCDKYFGKIAAQPLPKPVVSYDAPQRGERRFEIEYDANPFEYINWHTPQMGHPDLPALNVLANILSSGRTSRLYKNIREKKLGTADASVDESRLPGTFSCSLSPYGDHTLTELEAAVLAEIDKLKVEKVSDWELEKVRNKIDADFIRSLGSNLGMAFQIAGSEGLTGDWSYFLKNREDIRKVTADDVMQVANKYLTKSNRTVGYIVKTSASPNEGAAKSN